MSADKHKAKGRRMEILRQLGQHARGLLALNQEGGMPITKDVLRLVSDGVLKIIRRPTGSSFGPHIRKSYAVKVENALRSTRDFFIKGGQRFSGTRKDHLRG